MKNARHVGLFFTINNNKYVTYIDYRSKNIFRKLLETFSKNARIYTKPKQDDNFKFLPINSIISDAEKNLNIEKTKVKKIILNMKALNDDFFSK